MLQLNRGLALMLLACTSLWTRAAGPAPDVPAARYQTVPVRDGSIGKSYMGRPIAAVMGYQAAPWLERSERAREEDSDTLMKALALKPGMVVADIGAGTGYYSRRFAKAVGESGRVYAVDVQPQMLAMLAELSRQSGFHNIVPVAGAVDHVPLPDGSVDLAVMIDVYHELEFPSEMLQSIVRTLKSEGRVVFVEYRAEDDSVPIKPLHKMSIAQVRLEAGAQGLMLDRSNRNLPWQHLLIFRCAH